MTHSGSGNVVAGLYTALFGDTSAGSVYDLVSGRIYVLEAPRNRVLPLVVITLVDADTEYAYGYDYKDFIFQIDLYGIREDITMAALGAINDKLLEQLNLSKFPVTGHDDAGAQATESGVQTIEDDSIRIFTEWRVQAAQLQT